MLGWRLAGHIVAFDWARVWVSGWMVVVLVDDFVAWVGSSGGRGRGFWGDHTIAMATSLTGTVGISCA